MPALSDMLLKALFSKDLQNLWSMLSNSIPLLAEWAPKNFALV
eukprot:COSAG01_NODE_1522_length_10022_cov_81.163761_2_plen_43_part_00